MMEERSKSNVMKIIFIAIVLVVHRISSESLRYNSLISAQCKSRCLYEYRNTSRTLSRNVLILPWRSIWERCSRWMTCSSCLLPCDFDPTHLLSNKQSSCQAICSTLNLFECQQSCLFIQKLYKTNASNSRNIPQPSNLIAIERKSRRTVRLKWSINHAIESEPIFYVIEAQWMKRRIDENHYEIISKWGFVKEEVSNQKSIIRNIQRDNRWYRFRVTAVTRHGFSMFTETIQPFRLTNQSDIDLEPPKNFSMKDYQFNSQVMNVTLQWRKSTSLVTGYQISWRLKEDSSFISPILETSFLEITIPFLFINQTYLFRIRSMFSTELSSPVEFFFNLEDEENLSLDTLHISSPYFLNGLIKANLSWTFLPFQQYEISWIEHICQTKISSCCYERHAVTIEDSFQLYDLRFNCAYLVKIEWNQRILYRELFNVSSCQSIDVYGKISPPCLTDRQTMDIFSSLPTIDLIVMKNDTGWLFFWQNLQSTINHLFYRLNIQQLSNDHSFIQIDLPTVTRDYFLPYSKMINDRALYVTLSLIDGETIRQEQSIFISNHTCQRRTSSLLGFILMFLINLLSVY